jgi:hypothetical protein
MVGESVPLTKPSPYTKHWWSKELDIEHKAVHKLGRIAKKRAERRLDPIHKMYRIARNKFTESIKRAEGTKSDCGVRNQSLDVRSTTLLVRQYVGSRCA